MWGILKSPYNLEKNNPELISVERRLLWLLQLVKITIRFYQITRR